MTATSFAAFRDSTQIAYDVQGLDHDQAFDQIDQVFPAMSASTKRTSRSVDR